MTRQQTKGDIADKPSHSKAFNIGLGILVGEIELALKWNRPSILLAIHNSTQGRLEAQQSLEKELSKMNTGVIYIEVESEKPDVILAMNEIHHSGSVVFFVSGLESANRASNGSVYQALNIRREVLVEECICVVFWLNASEITNLPRVAPDFWSFRHRVVEFAPKRGSKKQSLPAGLFLWEEQIPWMGEEAQKSKLAYYEGLLAQLPEEGAISAHIETLLKLAHYSWLMDKSEKTSGYLRDSIDLLKKYPIPQYQAWAFNASGIQLYEEGNKTDASAHFKEALTHAPENSAIMMNSSITLHGLGKNSNSILTGRKAISKDEGNYQLWRAMGYLYLSMGRVEDAIECMKKAQGINPHEIDAYYSLAVCYYKNGQSAECLNELTKAEKISSPKNAIEHAYIDILNSKTDEALENLKRSLETGRIKKYHIQRDPNLSFLLKQ